MVATLVFVLVCLGRAVQLQAIEAQTIAAEAAMKMQNARDLLPNRGGDLRSQRGGAGDHGTRLPHHRGP